MKIIRNRDEAKDFIKLVAAHYKMHVSHLKYSNSSFEVQLRKCVMMYLKEHSTLCNSAICELFEKAPATMDTPKGYEDFEYFFENYKKLVNNKVERYD